MPRFKRLVVPGMPHHVIQRGNHRMNVFLDDDDRRVFLRMLAQVSERHGLLHLGYNLMTNHEHQLCIPMEEASLALAMRDLLGPYAAYFNGKYGLSGRLWQGRYYSAVLSPSHFWTALRYVELNPVRAGMVTKAEEYPWSSARAHCGLCEDPILSPLPDGAPSTADWSLWLQAGVDRNELKLLRDCTKSGRPCGDEAYIRELERMTGRILFPRRRGRPTRQSGGDSRKTGASWSVLNDCCKKEDSEE